MAAAEKWINDEFQPSVLSVDEQKAEMQWFIDAAAPFAGMEINVLSETIPTHTYEFEVLTKAFEEITGIKVNHQILGEGEVVQAVQTQMQTNRNLYDGYVNDSDLIGTHSRMQQAYNLTEQMAGAWADVTSPTLDLDDFMGTSFTTGPDGNLYQLPDQQFANLYWFRKDWFDNPDFQARFKEKYGYDLGVPVNWSAYEDIAEFFTNDVKEIDGVQVYGHMDYGKRAPDLGWRMTDAWLSMAGVGIQGRAERHPDRRVGHPHGGRLLQPGRLQDLPRRRGQRPGGGLRHRQVGRVAAQVRAAGGGQLRLLPVAAGARPGQRRPADLLVHGVRLAGLVKPKSEGNNIVDDEGNLLWRMAPSPHGPYWQEGQKVGYQDVGSWTILKSTPDDRAKAAWLYAQFVTSKTVDTKKSHVGLTFIRDSTVRGESFTERAPKLGGLVEFYRSPDRVRWSPTGINVPDYPKLAQIWWQQIGNVNSGSATPQEAMDALAAGDGRHHGPHAAGRRGRPTSTAAAARG